MPANPSSRDAPSWRRGGQSNSASQTVPTNGSRNHHAHRKDRDLASDNWRANAHPVTDSAKLHGAPPRSQPVSVFKPNGKATNGRSNNSHASNATQALLSSSLKRNKAEPLDSSWIPGQHPHPDPSASHAIKPSGMGNGVIGRSPEFGTSPTKSKGSGLAAVRHHWPLSSSLDQLPTGGPATKLHPLRIDPPESSRFFSSTSTPHKLSENNQHHRQHHQSHPLQRDSDRNENWMLTPTSSLPSIPSTPIHIREASMERSPGPASSTDANNVRATPSIRGPVENFQSSFNSMPRTPSPGHGLSRQEGGISGSLLFNRGSNVNVHASPKRSPLITSNLPQRQPVGNVTGTPVILSPAASPKLSHRTLSPMARHPPVLADAHTNGDRVVNSIASMLHGPTPQTRPGTASRRESFNSVLSVGAGHTMSHSRRSSAVLSPNSPTVSTRIGVYRPPHLRNRGSVSGLKPSVAHYDRVRTPSLRGLSRSRESSISLSRPTSRPPSTVPYYYNESIPEDGKADDQVRVPLRGRQSNMSIHLPDLIAEEQQRNAAAAAATPGPQDADPTQYVPNTTSLLEQPLDSASLLAKLRAQLVRREAAASDAAASEFDRASVITEDNEQDFFDLSDMMEYSASDGHPLSRYSSAYAIEGRPLGDVFEIGDLLGPGMEHDGHIIQIAETTPGFVDQNEDLTGSKLEVIRKLGEGSYAVVYLVKEVSAEEAATYISHKNIAIPNSTSKTGIAEAPARHSDDDADLTMVNSSEDLLSTTLKANQNGKEEGFHNSPALEERRRKDLKVNTQLRPGKEFALKCLCKRDLPEDMLEVQRLEATIHQSIPAHPNIVTLYRTYETPDWLFLVLEYCPGQDLYYWLEQAQDSGNPLAHLHDNGAEQDSDDEEPLISVRNAGERSTDSGDTHVLDSTLDHTPPSPSLLASTSGRGLLSKRRIRLIARMFRQICDAVQFCHDRGVSHRDIKPENFIVEDRRTIEEMQSACPDTSSSTLVDSTKDGDESRVIVKMTDFGLATAEDRCDDFDCGSKPYMAFECHNNVSSSYDPKQADIWSLGVVLLNLLFHRSPFTEPSMSCPSFAAYCHDPIRFLMESFDGLTETVARFLAENVFCSISNDDDSSQKRISAGEFSKWACGLVSHMGLSGPGPGRISRGASIYHTVPLMHSRTGSMSTLPSLLSSPRARARSLVRDPDHIPDLDATADATLRATYAYARQGSLSPHPALFTPDVLPSPTFTPSPQPPERNPFDTQYGAAATDSAHTPETIIEQEEHNSLDSSEQQRSSDAVSDDSQDAESKKLIKTEHDDSSQHPLSNSFTAMAESSSPAQVDSLSGQESAEPSTKEGLNRQADINGHGNEDDDDANADDAGEAEDEGVNGTEDNDKAESITTSNHSKRRKRGARKGRTLAKQLKRSQSVEGMADVDLNDPEARARERERTIRELALASENLARQMSKMAKPSDAADIPLSPTIVLSKPTAEAAARYSLQSKADAEVEAVQPSSGIGVARALKASDDGGVANWSSAAQRRERMSEQRKTGAAVLQDSGRSRVMSWRERNQSVATFSSLASSVGTSSSQSSTSSATSSIYSTVSAPAAMQRKDMSSRTRKKGSGFGLDTISEREKVAPSKVDAKYLAGIFGGADVSSQEKKRKESTSTRAGEQQAISSIVSSSETQNATSNRGDKDSNMRLGLASDNKGKADGSTSLLGVAAAKMPVNGDALQVDAGQRTVSMGSTTSNSSTSGVAVSFVSRFRRPSSSTSSTTTSNKGIVGIDADGAGADPDSANYLDVGIGLRRDASTSTGSLHQTKDAGGKPKASGGKEAAAEAPKKRGMGKFLLGVRDSIKNL